MHNVVIADSQEIFINGLELLINRRLDLRLVDICKNQKELDFTLANNEVEILLIDLARSDFDLSAIKNKIELKIIVISFEYGTLPFYVKEILEFAKMGISGFVAKDCGAKEINDAITAVIQKDKFFCKKILNIVLEKGFQIEECDPMKLSDRETEIVRLTAQGFTSKEVGQQLFISYHTVNTHRKKIMKKLGFKSSSELVVYAINTGLIHIS